MSCHQSSNQNQRLRPSCELYEPWWSTLAKWRRRNEGWLRQHLRSRRNPGQRTSISIEDERIDGRREPNVSEEQGEYEDDNVDNAALQLTRYRSKTYGSDPRGDKSTNLNDVSNGDIISWSGTTSKSSNDAKSDAAKIIQLNSNQTKKLPEQTATKIRGGGTPTSKNTSHSAAHHTSHPHPPQTPNPLASSNPSKNWVSRFKNAQKSHKSHRRRNRTQTSPSLNGLRFALHKHEYSSLGIEFSYADMTRAEWKFRNQNFMRGMEKENLGLGKFEKNNNRPGRSNLRYCLSYSRQGIDMGEGGRMQWVRCREWFSIRRTARAAVECIGF